MNNTKLQTTAQGQAGVLRVMSELILRGHVPYVPAADNHGVDILVDGVVRVQVKSTMRPSAGFIGKTRNWPPGTLTFSLSQTVHVAKHRYRRCAARKFSDYCDIVVLWAIEPNRFWIVPAHLLNGRYTLALTERQQFRDVDVSEAKRLLANGLSHAGVARHFDVAAKTLWRRLHGVGEPYRKNLTSAEVRKCEGRWDLIDQFVSTANQVNAIGTPKTAVIDRDAFLKS